MTLTSDPLQTPRDEPLQLLAEADHLAPKDLELALRKHLRWSAAGQRQHRFVRRVDHDRYRDIVDLGLPFAQLETESAGAHRAQRALHIARNHRPVRGM